MTHPYSFRKLVIRLLIRGNPSIHFRNNGCVEHDLAGMTRQLANAAMIMDAFARLAADEWAVVALGRGHPTQSAASSFDSHAKGECGGHVVPCSESWALSRCARECPVTA
jgi:hypothetical protein